MSAPMLDSAAVAAQLGNCNPQTAQRYMTSGVLRSAVIAGRRLTRQEWLDEFVDARAEGGPRLRVAGRRRAS